MVEDPRCGACGKDLSHRGRGRKEEQMACGACRKVPYCDMVCLEAHYLEHMEECFEAIAARVFAVDVHKDDSSGEHVLKDYVGACTARYGAWMSAGSGSMGPLCCIWGGWRSNDPAAGAT